MTDALPPPRYDHAPEMAIYDRVLSRERVNALCHDLGGLDWNGKKADDKVIFLGCSHRSPEGCEIWRINDAIVRRHEIGHCNGWPASHPR